MKLTPRINEKRETVPICLALRLFAVLVALSLSGTFAAQAQNGNFEPRWDSLNRRPIPAWYDEAKFGIFIHWGVYSVPAWGPKGTYAEWYWRNLETGRTDPGAKTEIKQFWDYHQRVYGAQFKYQDFAPQFKAELFDAAQWADLFARAGARYVVLTSKHHEGFTLWPSEQSENWNAQDLGPRRDVAGELSQAVKAKGLKMGFYYSLYEWFHPDYRQELANNEDRAAFNRYVEDHMLPQLRDLVTRYQPAVLWADGEWDHSSANWRAPEFLAWLFNQAPNKDEIVVNDRWGEETRSRHGGVFTLEYGQGAQRNQVLAAGRKWEENRGMGGSFGYNRNEDYRDYGSAAALIQVLIETVSNGGNLLLDIGPTADGRIPVVMQDRLMEIGNWLRVNGEAIYGTTPWRVSDENKQVFYTRKGATVYAHVLRWPERELTLVAPRALSGATVQLLGYEPALKWRNVNGALTIEMPVLASRQLPGKHAYVFKLTGVE